VKTAGRSPATTGNAPGVRLEYSETYSGALPHPRLLEQYERIVPGLAAEIIAQGREQTKHRIWAERTAIEASTAAEKRGQIFALIIAVSGFVTTIVLAWLNHPLVAGGVAGLDILGLVSVFLYGTSSRKDERIKKARIMTGRPTDETSPTRQ